MKLLAGRRGCGETLYIRESGEPTSAGHCRLPICPKPLLPHEDIPFFPVAANEPSSQPLAGNGRGETTRHRVADQIAEFGEAANPMLDIRQLLLPRVQVLLSRRVVVPVVPSGSLSPSAFGKDQHGSRLHNALGGMKEWPFAAPGGKGHALVGKMATNLMDNLGQVHHAAIGGEDTALSQNPLSKGRQDGKLRQKLPAVGDVGENEVYRAGAGYRPSIRDFAMSSGKAGSPPGAGAASIAPQPPVLLLLS